MIDLHIHTFWSDGELSPSEVVYRYIKFGYKAIAITDHIDLSNYRVLIPELLKFTKIMVNELDFPIIPGAELTFVPPNIIPEFVNELIQFGELILLVHGETIVEPVPELTNEFAIRAGVDILAHPGLIEEQLLKENENNKLYLEITSKTGHSLTNGYVYQIAKKTNFPLVLNSDSHYIKDILPVEEKIKIAKGAGLSNKEIETMFLNMADIVKKYYRRFKLNLKELQKYL